MRTQPIPTLKTSIAFAIAGSIAGVACVGLLYWPLRIAEYPRGIGFGTAYLFWILPIASAAVALAFAAALEFLCLRLPIGMRYGALVGGLSLIVPLAIPSVAAAGVHFIEVLPGFVIFGGLFFGPVVLACGVSAGYLLRRCRIANRPSDSP